MQGEREEERCEDYVSTWDGLSGKQAGRQAGGWASRRVNRRTDR